jgi:hypothetical protein
MGDEAPIRAEIRNYAPRRGGFQLTQMFGLRLASGQHPSDNVSRVEQDGFVLLSRDLDEA